MLGRGVRPRVWRRCHAPVTGLLGRIRARLRRQPRTAQKPRWLYKVVQMVPHQPPDPEQASRKLSGALSAEGLRKQFPEIYAPSAQGNPREQINGFMDRLGDDGWEFVQIYQLGDLPLMIFKRPNNQALEKSSGDGPQP